MNTESRPVLSISDVKAIFEREFAALGPKFNVLALSVAEAEHEAAPSVNAPGVYVHWHPERGVLKVGKSQKNSKARAFQHFQSGPEWYVSQMRQLKEHPSYQLLLFNVRERSDLHWVLSLEAYLERELHPAFPSFRNG